MHTFLLCVDRNPERAQHAVARCAARLDTVLAPRVGALAIDEGALLPPMARYCTAVPRTTARPGLVSVAARGDRAVIAFGEAGGVGATTAAGPLLDAWCEGGPAAARRLAGCFGAALLDGRQGTVTVLHDHTAQRRLFHYRGDGFTAISPHDATLAGAGLFPAQPDETALATAIACGWSAGGRSYLSGVASDSPNHFTVIDRHAATRVADPILESGASLDPADGRAVARHIDGMIDQARRGMRQAVAGHDRINLEMSAGADSRCVFLLARSAVADTGATIIPICTGAPRSADVRVARDMCARYGLDFLAQTAETPAADAFRTELDRLAFTNNGDANANRLLIQPTNGYPGDEILQLHGNGGEIYRGYTYPHAGGPLSTAQARDVLRGQITRRVPAAFAAEAAAAAVDRFVETVDGYAPLCRDGHDLMDLVYACERNAVWGQARARMTWQWLWGPYSDAALMRAAFRLPAPIGRPPRLHLQILRRLAPELVWLPVNDRWVFPLQGGGPGVRLLDRGYRRIRSVRNAPGKLRRMARRAGILTDDTPKADMLNIEHLRGRAVAGLRAPLAALLTDRGTATGGLIDADGVHRLMEEHVRGARSHTLLIGSLATIESWWSLVREMRG